ncbi:coiled-coil and C2 domain-containing protein 2A-like [Halichondria panicea]|uniref:coiled-coil and C2 domain-containing protein 2A-like n=1 Tax=Halichondria panicea TaxID=6063 RepID=UPI00312B2D54
MATNMEDPIVAVATDDHRERDLREAFQRRSATLRETLKLKPTVGDGHDQGTGAAENTETSFTNTKSLLESLKDRRLKRKGQLPPLQQTPPPVGPDTAESAGSSEPGVDLQERLRQRIQRRQGDLRSSGDTFNMATELDPAPKRKLRGLRDQPRVTRFDEPLPDEPLTRFPTGGEEIEQSNRLRRRALYRTATVEEVKQRQAHVLDQDAYDFFTSEIENCSFPDVPTRLPDQSQEEEPAREFEDTHGSDHDTSDTVALREQLLQQIQNEQVEAEEVDNEVDNEEEAPMIREQSSGDYRELLTPGYARYTPYRVRVAREEDTFFTPSTTPVSAEQKTPDSGPPHYAQDEGLYVGERPHVLWTNQVAMENRLLRREDKGAGWFGDDGLLLVQPNPLSQIRTRPPILQYSPRRPVSFKHARYEVKNQKLISKGSGEAEYELVVNVSSLHFQHHPLFSIEHILSSKLQQACSQLSKRRMAKAQDYYLEKLQGLRQAVIDLQQALQNQEGCDETEARLMGYLREVSRVREQRREALTADYHLLKTILKTWQDLKALRDNQGYSSTSAWVTVKRLLVNAVNEEGSLRRELEEEVEELRELHTLDSRGHALDYQRELANWKIYEKARRRAVRETTRIQQQQTLDDQSQVEGSQTSLNNNPIAALPPERPRPIPPPAFNEDQVRAELLDYQHRHLKPPGDPILTPEFRHNHALTGDIPRLEAQRREDTARAKLHVRVLFNNQLVSQTKECTLNSDFTSEIHETFNLKIVEWPESIKLEIFESGLITSTLISEVYVPIPDPLLTADSAGAGREAYQFSSTKRMEYGHTGVGSGQPHPVLPEEGVLLTSGVVKVGAYWGVDNSGRSLCPPGLSQPTAYSSDAISSLGMTGIADLQAVKRWIERSRLDPNDPRNAELLHLLESIPASSEETSHFRLVDVDSALRFMGDEEFEGDRRFTVLRSRHDGHPGLKNESVPLESRWISETEWRAVLNYRPYADYDIPLLLFGDFHSIRKTEQNKFLLDIRERVLSKARSGKEDLNLEDVVHAFSVPDVSAMRKVVGDLFSPRRPLNPVRNTRRKPKRLNAHVSSAKILVRVVRALNVPIRTTQQSTGVLAHPLSSLAPHLSLTPHQTDSEGVAMEPGPSGALPLGLELADPQSGFSPQELKIVCPYVEIGFRGSVMRTATAYGPQPFWNEEISVPFQPPDNDFSPGALQKITDSLYISLFDEVVTDILSDERQRSTNIHHRIEKKWLGSFTIPFSTLHQRERVEGMFRVEVPLVLLGYSQAADEVLEMTTHTHLQLFITLEPTLSVLPPLKDKFESEEDPRLLGRSQAWIRKIRDRFPKRNYLATALDVGGRHVFVTRFVKAQNPPVEIMPPQDAPWTVAAMEQLAHYVSLIPFLSDTLTFSGECDIWNTSDQFLHMLAGDEEEHALLLCNYLLHCGLEAWVVMGHAIPEGSTSYVLTCHPGLPLGSKLSRYLLWNPNTGHHYLHDEPHIPLKSVGCVLNQYNVWANVQEEEDPAKIRYDLSNSKHWQPLFPFDMPPLDSVQQELDYCETDIGRVRDLQEKIERTIHDHITSLRDRFITRWNRHCSQVLHTLLPRLEESYPASPPHTELNEITASYKLTGFPVHSPYVDAQHLVAAVERTGVHLCEDPQVEFALAVYVHPYPNDIVSIWLYIASLIPN